MKTKTIAHPINKTTLFNMKALKQLADDHAKINRLIEEGKEIDPELSKNFVTFPISNNSIEK
jgi:hypothetical protein